MAGIPTGAPVSDPLTHAFTTPTLLALLPHAQVAAENLNRITTADPARGPYGTWLFGAIAAGIAELQADVEQTRRLLAEAEARVSKKRSLDDIELSKVVGSDGDTKRRRIEESEKNGVAIQDQPSTAPVGHPSMEILDISFSVPARKKFTLQIIPASPIGRPTPSTGAGTDGRKGGIRAVDASSGAIQFGIPWDDIEQIICVSVPEKAQQQYNFIVVPQEQFPASASSPAEAIIFNVPATVARNVTVDETRYGPNPAETETFEAMLQRILNHELAPFRKAVVLPSRDHFASSLVQAHRKTETAFHVKAFRGSKDGFLYFLPVGILFGFKKPVSYFPFASIHSISYTSVLQRTFNIVIAVAKQGAASDVTGPVAEDEADLDETEFMMIDQADFAGIDTYVKRHGLHDASLAASRKAKHFNVNGQPQRAVNGAGGDAEHGDAISERAVEAGTEENEEEDELARAERELQDAEDEEEEDYDPGSEGESEGSGTSDDEDGGGGYTELDADVDDAASEDNVAL